MSRGRCVSFSIELWRLCCKATRDERCSDAKTRRGAERVRESRVRCSCGRRKVKSRSVALRIDEEMETEEESAAQSKDIGTCAHTRYTYLHETSEVRTTRDGDSCSSVNWRHPISDPTRVRLCTLSLYTVEITMVGMTLCTLLTVFSRGTPTFACVCVCVCAWCRTTSMLNFSDQRERRNRKRGQGDRREGEKETRKKKRIKRQRCHYSGSPSGSSDGRAGDWSRDSIRLAISPSLPF